MADRAIRFKIDENLPREFVQMLERAGHDAVSVPDQRLSGVADQKVDEVCSNEGRVLVTLDVAFGDVRRYAPQDRPGIVLLRVGSQQKQLIDVFARVVSLLGTERIAQCLWIDDESGVRIRIG
jgi:predicted nuclease of predicted toxin-antitoxin system